MMVEKFQNQSLNASIHTVLPVTIREHDSLNYTVELLKRVTKTVYIAFVL